MRRILALLLVFVMIAGLAGCSFLQPQPEPTEPTEPSVMAPPEPVRKKIHILMPESMKAQGMELINQVVAETLDMEVSNYSTAEEQINLLNEIAAQSPKDGSYGVVMIPASREMGDVFAALTEANVSYALAELVPDGAEAASVANVQYDQHAIGAAAAAYLVSKGLEEGDKVLLLAGLSEEEAQRTEGFKLYLQGKIQHEGQTIADSWSSLSSIVYSDMQGTTREDAKNYFVSFMDSSSNAKTKYIAAWDDTYVLGILDALAGDEIDAERRQTFLERAPHLTGFGGSKDLCDVMSGTVPMECTASLGSLATMNHSADLLTLAVQAMADYFTGTVVEQDQTQPIVWVSGETVSKEPMSVEG